MTLPSAVLFQNFVFVFPYLDRFGLRSTLRKCLQEVLLGAEGVKRILECVFLLKTVLAPRSSSHSSSVLSRYEVSD